MALANQVLDFVDDVDRRLLRQIVASAPEHVKTASVLTANDREKLSSEQFALIMRSKEEQELKKFPIVDPASTWLSCQYFAKTAEQLPFVAQKIAASNLQKACAIYNIKAPDMIDKLASKGTVGNRYDEVAKSAAEPGLSKIAVAHKPDGSTHFYALGERYAMPTPEYVKKAAAYFAQHEREFSDAEDRHTFALNVLERAKELDVDIEGREQLSKYASHTYGDSVSTQLRLRREFLQHEPKFVEALDKLSSHKASTEAEVFAKALYLFDKKAHLTKHYGSHLSDAFKATFGVFQKTAGYQWENQEGSVSISGTDLVKAAENKYDRIKSYFGQTLADNMKKHAVEIFDSLPIDAKETIAKIAQGTM